MKNGIQTTWPTRKLVECGDWVSGGTPSKSVAGYWNGDIPWISSKSLKSFDLRDSEDRITQAAVDDGTSLVPTGTVMFVVRGMSLANEFRVGVTTRPVAFNQDLRAIIPAKDIDGRYFDPLPESKPAIHHRLGEQRFARNETTPTEMIGAVSVPIPPLSEQRRIAAILDKADAIRCKREEGIRLTEELLCSTFLKMFGDPATNPKGWETEKLGELSSIRRGSSPRPIENYMGGDVPWIKIGDATKGDSFYITETEDHVTQAGAEKSVLLEPGALVIANSGVSLGFARILKIKGCVHDGWLSLENLDKRLNKIYLLRLVNCLTDHFRAIAPDGTQPNLNTGIMKEFRVAIPPINLQKKFERAAYAIVEMTAARKKAALEAESLFCSIVQRAFRGEL